MLERILLKIVLRFEKKFSMMCHLAVAGIDVGLEGLGVALFAGRVVPVMV